MEKKPTSDLIEGNQAWQNFTDLVSKSIRQKPDKPENQKPKKPKKKSKVKR